MPTDVNKILKTNVKNRSVCMTYCKTVLVVLQLA